MSDSTFLETLNALVLAAKSQTGAGQLLEGVSIADGPVTQRTSERLRLFIGTSSDGLSAEGDNPESQIPGVIDSENFAILCVADAWENSFINLRTYVFGVRSALRQLLRPAPSQIVLGVTSLASARIGAWTFEQMQTPSGPYAGLTIRVECISRPGTN